MMSTVPDLGTFAQASMNGMPARSASSAGMNTQRYGWSPERSMQTKFTTKYSAVKIPIVMRSRPFRARDSVVFCSEFPIVTPLVRLW